MFDKIFIWNNYIKKIKRLFLKILHDVHTVDKWMFTTKERRIFKELSSYTSSKCVAYSL